MCTCTCMYSNDNIVASFPASPPHARTKIGGEKRGGGGGESGIFYHVGDVR